MSLYTVLPGSTPSGGSGTPGGPVGSIQYNAGAGNFGGFGNYDNGSGIVTLPDDLILDGDISSDFTINSITFESNGGGTLFLADDGTYKAAGSESFNSEVPVISISYPVVFTLPTTVAADASIEYDTDSFELRVVNNDGTDTLEVSFRAIWEADLVGYPQHHYPSTGSFVSIVGAGALYFTNTDLPIVGLELDATPKGIQIYLRIRSTNSGNTIVMNFNSLVIDQGGTLFVTTHGTFGEL